MSAEHEAGKNGAGPDRSMDIEEQRLALLKRYMTPTISDLIKQVERWKSIQVQTWQWPKYEIIKSTKGTGFAIANRYPEKGR